MVLKVRARAGQTDRQTHTHTIQSDAIERIIIPHSVNFHGGNNFIFIMQMFKSILNRADSPSECDVYSSIFSKPGASDRPYRICKCQAPEAPVLLSVEVTAHTPSFLLYVPNNRVRHVKTTLETVTLGNTRLHVVADQKL